MLAYLAHSLNAGKPRGKSSCIGKVLVNLESKPGEFMISEFNGISLIETFAGDIFITFPTKF